MMKVEKKSEQERRKKERRPCKVWSCQVFSLLLLTVFTREFNCTLGALFTKRYPGSAKNKTEHAEPMDSPFKVLVVCDLNLVTTSFLLLYSFLPPLHTSSRSGAYFFLLLAKQFCRNSFHCVLINFSSQTFLLNLFSGCSGSDNSQVRGELLFTAFS